MSTVSIKSSQALGEEKLSLLGLSYGTRLGAVYADLFPARVRAIVLDGAIDPIAPLDQQARDEAEAAWAGGGKFPAAAAGPAGPAS